jgi:hypothetical protein
MYARSSTFRARTESLDAGIEYTRDEVLPAILGMEGCVGLSLLVNRESGLCISTSAWRSLEALRASEDQVGALRERMAGTFGGPAEVEQWEIAVMHRDHRSQQGARVRATWVQTDPTAIDRVVDFTKNITLPALDGLDGFCSASLMIDRATGRGVVAVSFDTAAAEENSRETARGLRDRFVEETREKIIDIQQFDLVLAHLHAPELV